LVRPTLPIDFPEERKREKGSKLENKRIPGNTLLKGEGGKGKIEAQKSRGEEWKIQVQGETRRHWIAQSERKGKGGAEGKEKNRKVPMCPWNTRREKRTYPRTLTQNLSLAEETREKREEKTNPSELVNYKEIEYLPRGRVKS